VVVLNAAAVLVAAGKGEPVTARGLAEQAIDSGRAADLLARWAKLSKAKGDAALFHHP
jgi:anthranilate phosphoribosyltransferase